MEKYLVAGLGNIGDEYANTRHNIGFIVADALAMEGKINFEPARLADLAKMKFRARPIHVIKPSTFMNLSGKSVKYWLDKEDIPLKNLLVIVDDLALPHGSVRLRTKGGDGGHNGLISIIESLGTTNFARLRMGIGNDFSQGHQVDYVLGKWTAAEEKLMIPAVKEAIEIIKSFISIGPARTMNTFNKRGEGKGPQD